MCRGTSDSIKCKLPEESSVQRCAAAERSSEKQERKARKFSLKSRPDRATRRTGRLSFRLPTPDVCAPSQMPQTPHPIPGKKEKLEDAARCSLGPPPHTLPRKQSAGSHHHAPPSLHHASSLQHALAFQHAPARDGSASVSPCPRPRHMHARDRSTSLCLPKPHVFPRPHASVLPGGRRCSDAKSRPEMLLVDSQNVRPIFQERVSV